MRKSNIAFETPTHDYDGKIIDWAKVPGLRTLRRRSNKLVGKCHNCKCDRYNPCTCTKKVGAQ
jgi:hypothetical protein